MHCSLVEKIRLPFIDSDLFYTDALYGRFDRTVVLFIFICGFFRGMTEIEIFIDISIRDEDT